MRTAILAVLGACATPAPPVAAPPPVVTTPPVAPTSNAVEGTVTDRAGSPIAGAEIVVCVRQDPCTFIAQHSEYTDGGVRDILASVPEVERANRDLIVTRTDAAGRWRVERAPDAPTIAWVLILAADYVDVQFPQPTAADLREVSLLPAAAIDLVPTCSPAPCPEPYVASLKVDGRFYNSFLHSTHLRHVPLRRYTAVLHAHVERPGEQRGEATLDLAALIPASAPLAIAVALAPTGTGRAITGSGAPPGIDVYARCGEVVRYARSTGGGDFRIDDVGPPPCQLECEIGTLVHLPDRRDAMKTEDDCKGTKITALPAHVRVRPHAR